MFDADDRWIDPTQQTTAPGHTVPGGGVILVEKVLGSSAQFEELLTRRYYALKAMNGYTAEQIQRKRLAAQGRARAGHGPRERGSTA